MALVSTGELARQLGVSRGAIVSWVHQGLLEPDERTMGGHMRWDVERVRQVMRDRRQRDES